MEDLHKLKKSFIERFESTLSLIGKNLTKELEDKYLIDKELYITNSFNLCFKLVKMEGITPEDKKKCKEFLDYFYYLEEIKSMY